MVRIAHRTSLSMWASLTLAGFLIGCVAADPLPRRCDLAIVGGTVVDGTGTTRRTADVLVVGDRIAAVVEPGTIEARGVAVARTLDAAGKVVTPGFIDVHAHGDPLRTPELRNFVSMGVTTVCFGLDGSSPGRGGVGEWLDRVEGRRTGPNVAAFVGHGSVRRQAGVPDGSPADAAQREAMATLVDAAMREGAFGLSSGIEYVPGRFADAAELAAIAVPVGEHGGIVCSHVRSEDADAVGAAVAELIAQCAGSGAVPHLSHAKIVYGHEPEQADELLRMLRDAGGSADVYPYTASFTGLSILFPDWALPPHDYAQVVAERRADLADHLRRRVTARNGPAATLFGSGPYAGRTLEAASREAEMAFEELLIELGPGGASAAYFVMDEAVMERFVVDPRVMIASDGSPTMRHPRGHGTFAKVIRSFVVERQLLTLEEAVRKMTSLPAVTLGLPDRGEIAVGHCADLLVFDPAHVEDLATFTRPFERATGFDTVIVNGVAVIEAGQPTGERPGRALRQRNI